MPINISMCWSIFRMTFRFFAEGIFIYLLINTNSNELHIPYTSFSLKKKNLFLFSFIYSLVALVVSLSFKTMYLFRLVPVILIFYYFWRKRKKIHEKTVINYNGIQDVWYALTTAIILILAVDSFNSIGHMLLHTFAVSIDIYDTINRIRIFRELYKTAIMFLDVFFIFLAYKFRFIKMKDIKAMSTYKRIPITFGLCLLSLVYINSAYTNVPSIAQYHNLLLWTIAFILPVYIGFYITTAYLTRLISIKTNYKVDIYIHIWLFNPSLPMFKTTGLSVYDSNTFMSNFESKKMTIRNKLRKLGITDDYEGYSELVLCLFLTSLFVGLKG